MPDKIQLSGLCINCSNAGDCSYRMKSHQTHHFFVKNFHVPIRQDQTPVLIVPLSLLIFQLLQYRKDFAAIVRILKHVLCKKQTAS